MCLKVADYPGYAPLSFRDLRVPRTQGRLLEGATKNWVYGISCLLPREAFPRYGGSYPLISRACLRASQRFSHVLRVLAIYRVGVHAVRRLSERLRDLLPPHSRASPAQAESRPADAGSRRGTRLGTG